jgi:hypothetical protein
MSEGFCTLCNIDVPSFEGLSQCPNCRTRNRPCAHEDDLTVKLNRHELHILCVWAERWGMKIVDEEEDGGPGVIYAIVHRLKQRNAELADASLTLADEMDALRDAGYNFETNIPGVEDNPND